MINAHNCCINDSKILNAIRQSTSSNETLWEWIYAFEDLQVKSTQLVHDMFDILRGILLIFNKILTFQNWLFIHT
jgi:hypothetical protein